MTTQDNSQQADKRRPGAANRFMRIDDVVRETGLPRSTVYAKAKAGTFPKPIKLSPRISAWEVPAVLAWVDERIKESAAADANAA